MLATVVVVCPSGSSVSASMPTAIVIDVGAAASPPVGTPDSATPAAHTRTTASGGLICLRLIVVLPPFAPGRCRRTRARRFPRAGVVRFYAAPSLSSPGGGRRRRQAFQVAKDGSASSTSNSRIGVGLRGGVREPG